MTPGAGRSAPRAPMTGDPSTRAGARQVRRHLGSSDEAPDPRRELVLGVIVLAIVAAIAYLSTLT